MLKNPFVSSAFRSPSAVFWCTFGVVTYHSSARVLPSICKPSPALAAGQCAGAVTVAAACAYPPLQVELKHFYHGAAMVRG